MAATPIIAASTAYLQIRNKVEHAFAWYFEERVKVDNPASRIAVAEVNMWAAERAKVRDRKTPCFVFEAAQVQDESPGHGVWRFDLQIHAMIKYLGSGDETADLVLGELTGEMVDFLSDSAAVRVAMNAPTGTDDRAVRDFHLVSYAVTDQFAQRIGSTGVQTVMLSGVCHGWDVVPQATSPTAWDV